jgi:hypothetical protein
MLRSRVVTLAAEGFPLAPSFQVPAIGTGSKVTNGKEGLGNERMGKPLMGAMKMASVADLENGGGAARV